MTEAAPKRTRKLDENRKLVPNCAMRRPILRRARAGGGREGGEEVVVAYRRVPAVGGEDGGVEFFVGAGRAR